MQYSWRRFIFNWSHLWFSIIALRATLQIFYLSIHVILYCISVWILRKDNFLRWIRSSCCSETPSKLKLLPWGGRRTYTNKFGWRKWHLFSFFVIWKNIPDEQGNLRMAIWVQCELVLMVFGWVRRMFWHSFKAETFTQIDPIILLWIITKPVTCIP